MGFGTPRFCLPLITGQPFGIKGAGHITDLPPQFLRQAQAFKNHRQGIFLKKNSVTRRQGQHRKAHGTRHLGEHRHSRPIKTSGITSGITSHQHPIHPCSDHGDKAFCIAHGQKPRQFHGLPLARNLIQLGRQFGDGRHRLIIRVGCCESGMKPEKPKDS